MEQKIRQQATIWLCPERCRKSIEWRFVVWLCCHTGQTVTRQKQLIFRNLREENEEKRGYCGRRKQQTICLAECLDRCFHAGPHSDGSKE